MVLPPPSPYSYWIPSCQQIPLPTFTCFCVSMACTVWSEVLSWVEEGGKGSPSLGSPVNDVKHVFIVLSLEFGNLSLSLSTMHACTHAHTHAHVHTSHLSVLLVSYSAAHAVLTCSSGSCLRPFPHFYPTLRSTISNLDIQCPPPHIASQVRIHCIQEAEARAWLWVQG